MSYEFLHMKEESPELNSEGDIGLQFSDFKSRTRLEEQKMRSLGDLFTTSPANYDRAPRKSLHFRLANETKQKRHQ